MPLASKLVAALGGVRYVSPSNWKKRKRGNEGLLVHDCPLRYRSALWKGKRQKTSQAKPRTAIR